MRASAILRQSKSFLATSAPSRYQVSGCLDIYRDRNASRLNPQDLLSGEITPAEPFRQCEAGVEATRPGRMQSDPHRTGRAVPLWGKQTHLTQGCLQMRSSWPQSRPLSEERVPMIGARRVEVRRMRVFRLGGHKLFWLVTLEFSNGALATSPATRPQRKTVLAPAIFDPSTKTNFGGPH